MAFRGLRRFLGALALIWALGAGGAEASTIYTYSFSEDYNYSLGAGYIYPAKLTGGFTGTSDATGHISLSTLTDFHLTFDFPPGGVPGLAFGTYAGAPDYFSFLIGDASGSTLAFQSPLDLYLLPSDETACVGAAVAFLCSGGASRGVVATSFGIFARSEIAPSVSLVTTSAPVAATPIPGGLLLLGTALAGLGGLGGLGAVRRKMPA
ncbi:hypothetical protein [Dongia sp.]|uniref:hypothetical protein n=1 Tax=Dongia sp. TaxID=1977262 RepID=UPI00375162BA